MPSGIQHHGNLERLVKAEAERYGWKAKVENVGIDPIVKDAFGMPRQTPNRGDVYLTNDGTGRTVHFEYELPEYQDQIEAQVRAIIQADHIPNDAVPRDGIVQAS